MKTNLFNNKFPSLGGVRGGFLLPLLRRGLGGGFLVLAMAFAGCEKNDDSNEPDFSGPGNITLTAVPDNYAYGYYKVGFYATAQQLAVDWGDGSTAETYTNTNGNAGDTYGQITHTYTDSGTYTYTIQIVGEGLTDFIIEDSYADAIIFMDVSRCPTLQSLGCYACRLPSLDVSKCTALRLLDCSLNQLTALDVSKCTALQRLDCSANQLTALDVSKCTALQELDCTNYPFSLNNPLTSLNVSGCTALQHLDCEYNQLPSLDVSGCTALVWLNCRENQLTSLNVNGCTALEVLRCEYNQIHSLNVSGCTALQGLYCRDNQLTAPALNTVFTALPNRTGEDYTSYISIYGNPGANSCNQAIAENKGWSVWW